MEDKSTSSATNLQPQLAEDTEESGIARKEVCVYTCT